MPHSPEFPIYIPSKGRHEYMMTSKALTKMGIHHHVIVEPQQMDDYRRAVHEMALSVTLLELDMGMKSRYDLCDTLGLSKSTGSGPARNFAWEHARSIGAPFHWTIDDNIQFFARLNHNMKIPVADGSTLYAMETFVQRYRNIAMAGPNYWMFAPRKTKQPPYVLNTRIYSCNLIRTDLPFRWRGRYNEDTILSIDLLKAGWCTVLFNAFLQYKLPTQTLKGGNTDELYHGGGAKAGQYSPTGTIEKSQMLVRTHGDVARIVQRFNRVHHHVDYRGFTQRLVKRPGVVIPQGVNNFGMELVKLEGVKSRLA